MKPCRLVASVAVAIPCLLAAPGSAWAQAAPAPTSAAAPKPPPAGPAYGTPTRLASLGVDPPTGITTDANGDLFVVDGDLGGGHDRVMVKKRSATGLGTLKVLPFSFSSDAAMSGVATDPAGDVVATDGTGAVVLPADPSAAGGYGPEITLTPGDLPVDSVVNEVATDADDDVFLGAETYGGGADTIIEYPRDGSGYGADVVIPCDQSGQLIGLATDAAGDVIIGESDAVAVLPLTATGYASPVVTDVAHQVSAMASDAGGNVYLVEASTGVHANKLVELAPSSSTPYTYTPTSNTGLKAISASKLVSGLAVTATDVYVSFYAFESNEVADYARTGTTLAAPTRVKVAGLSATGDVAVDGSGDVIASDTGRDRVVEIMTSGTTVTLPFVGLTQPTAVAVDPSGDVFVIDTSPGTANPAFDGRVLELPWDGDGYGKQVTILDTGADGTGLQGLATDSSGHLFVGSYEGTANSVSVMEFTDTDDVYQQTETMPMSTGANIFALAIDPAGNLFVNTSSGTLANQYQTCPYTQCTIWEIPLTSSGYGTPISVATGLQPYALAVDAADDVFAFDGTVSNNDVVVLTDSSTGWSSPVPVPFGTVQDPVSLAAEPSGTLFLGEAFVAGDAAIEQLPVTTS